MFCREICCIGSKRKETLKPVGKNITREALKTTQNIISFIDEISENGCNEVHQLLMAVKIIETKLNSLSETGYEESFLEKTIAEIVETCDDLYHSFKFIKRASKLTGEPFVLKQSHLDDIADTFHVLKELSDRMPGFQTDVLTSNISEEQKRVSKIEISELLKNLEKLDSYVGKLNEENSFTSTLELPVPSVMRQSKLNYFHEHIETARETIIDCVVKIYLERNDHNLSRRELIEQIIAQISSEQSLKENCSTDFLLQILEATHDFGSNSRWVSILYNLPLKKACRSRGESDPTRGERNSVREHNRDISPHIG